MSVAISPNKAFGTTVQESTYIRSKLELLYSQEAGCYQVFTKLHGIDELRWISITEPTAKWYSTQFNLQMPSKEILK
jgi:hypothetical protein